MGILKDSYYSRKDPYKEEEREKIFLMEICLKFTSIHYLKKYHMWINK